MEITETHGNIIHELPNKQDQIIIRQLTMTIQIGETKIRYIPEKSLFN